VSRLAVFAHKERWRKWKKYKPIETISLLILICRLRWIEGKTLSEHKSAGEEIAKMLNSLIKSLKTNKPSKQ
jgi:hypothetical protein